MDSKQLRAIALAKLSEMLEPTDALSDEREEQLRKLFAGLDTNGDGWISREELRQLYVEEAAVDQALAATDLDGDGGLSLEELFIVNAEQELDALEGRAWAVFSGFDIDGDCVVERGEITAIGDESAKQSADMLMAAIGETAAEIDYEAFLVWFARGELGEFSVLEE